MSDLTLAGAAPSAPVALSAADLAARIPVPRRLPERYDGAPLRHLSPSSYALWVACPEAWRRRYICGERPAPTGSIFLGARVDDPLSAYFRRLLEHGDRLSLDQLIDLYRDHWVEALEAERDKQGIDWEEELSQRAAFELGRDAIRRAIAELAPWRPGRRPTPARVLACARARVDRAVLPRPRDRQRGRGRRARTDGGRGTRRMSYEPALAPARTRRRNSATRACR